MIRPVVTDPRVNRGHNHNLLDMVFITICAVISGADRWADVERFGKAKRGWLQQFLTLSYGIPSHDTFGRVFARRPWSRWTPCIANGTLRYPTARSFGERPTIWKRACPKTTPDPFRLRVQAWTRRPCFSRRGA